MRRPWPVTSVLVGVILLSALLVGIGAGPAAAAAPSATEADGGPVVVIGVPDLRWEDVAPETTPTLWRLAGRSSVASLTDRSGERATRATGWLTLNTGTRAVTGVDAETLPDPGSPGQLAALRAVNQAAAYQAQVGALGDALRQAGRKVAVLGSGAVLGAMDGAGRVAVRANSLAAALGSADVAVIEYPQLYSVDRSDPVAVQGALAAIDQGVTAALAALPAGGTLLVAGVSEGVTGHSHLHVALASGPAFPAGRLSSASTGRAGVVQLIDVAPTVLTLLGTPVPAVMVGAPWHAVAGSSAPRAQLVAGFDDLDRHAVTTLAAMRWYYPAVVWTALLFVVGAALAWSRGRTRLLRPIGAVVAALPIAGYLAQLVPWWRLGTWPLAPLAAGLAVALGLAATATPWARRSPWGAPALIGGGTAAVLALDAATGSRLSLAAPFADNPLIAGRFHGLGNVAFALLGAGTLLAAAAAAVRHTPPRGAGAVFGLGAAAVVVDGLPFLGDDLGGSLALVPAVAVLGFTLSRIRLSLRHVLAAAGAAVLIAGAFAAYDFSRPAADRTHVGRFLTQLNEGVAGVVVRRKLESSLASLTTGWGRWLVAGWVLLALVAWALSRRGRLRMADGVDGRTARGLVLGLAVLGLLGAALNDSGVEVPAFALYLAVPLLVPFLEPVPDPPAPPAPEPRVEGHAGTSRT